MATCVGSHVSYVCRRNIEVRDGVSTLSGGSFVTYGDTRDTAAAVAAGREVEHAMHGMWLGAALPIPAHAPRSPCITAVSLQL